MSTQTDNKTKLTKLVGLTQSLLNDAPTYDEIPPYNGEQLFEGQTAYPLSEAEKEAFMKKVHVTSGDRKVINDALLYAFEQLLACRFVREVNLNHPNISFDINVVQELENHPSAAGLYRSSEKKIYIKATKMTLSKEQIASTLCHEMLHQVQDESLPGSMSENPVLKDAETNALSCAMEHKQDFPFCVSLCKNWRKWKEIVKGKRPRPSWAPAFKCLVPGQEYMAREAYVKEMVLLETNAQYIKDFVQTEQWGKGGKTHLTSASYGNYATQQYYKQQPFYAQKNSANTNLFIRDIIKRNPGLELDDFKDMYTYNYFNGVENREEYERQNNAYIRQRKAMKKINKEIEELSPAEQERLASKLPEELRNKDLGEYEKKLLLSIPYVMESKELTSEAKKELIAKVIDRLIHFPGEKPTPERKYAVEQLEKLNGYEMPVVQNTPNLRGRLIDSSKPYDDEALPNVSLPREGNHIA